MRRHLTVRTAPRAGNPAVGGLLITAAILASLVEAQPARADNQVTGWNQEFLNLTQQTSGNLVAGPPEVAREIAIIGNAMSDAVTAATGGNSFYAYAGGVVARADANVAAAAAAYTALSSIYNNAAWQTPISTVNGGAPNSSNVNLANNVILPQLSAFLTADLNSLGLGSPGSCTGSSSVLCLGFNLGVAAANAVIAKQSTDGAVAAIQNGLLTNKPSTGPDLLPGTSGTTPGVYVPPAARPEMFPTWGGVTPTSLTAAQLSAVKGSVGGPPAIGSQAYATALLQTECQGSSVGQSGLSAVVQAACGSAGFTQTAVQAKADATAALFWNDPGTTVQPPGHWLQIADAAMKSQNTSLLQSAQLTAILGEAQTDAGIAAWGEKYTYNLWRPITAIRACDTSGSGSVTWNADFTTCDAGWSSLIATPPHPDYLAGHPAFSGAAANVLADFFGTDTVGFSSTSSYYCNGGTTGFNSNNMPVSCTALSGRIFYICSATTSPDFVNGLPLDCNDGQGNTTALTGNDCNTITTTGVNNGSPLICPITETFSSFSDASSGPSGSEFSRVVGGIHTPFSVTDALTLGNQIGTFVAVNNGLPDLVPEPSSLSLCAVSLLALTRLRRRRPSWV